MGLCGVTYFVGEKSRLHEMYEQPGTVAAPCRDAHNIAAAGVARHRALSVRLVMQGDQAVHPRHGRYGRYDAGEGVTHGDDGRAKGGSAGVPAGVTDSVDPMWGKIYKKGSLRGIPAGATDMLKR